LQQQQVTAKAKKKAQLAGCAFFVMSGVSFSCLENRMKVISRFLGGNVVKLALAVKLEAKPGKETELEKFLNDGLALAQQEPATSAWFALRFGKSTFGIFDVFRDEAGRQAHLSGPIAAALMQKAPELLAAPPSIEKVEVIAAKLPGDAQQGRTAA
jgi:quinol monooxygenase YgiN